MTIPRQCYVEEILHLAYCEVASPHLRSLRASKTQAETYRELSVSFISRLLREYKITYQSRVVDLGSGMGNVVQQVRIQCNGYAYSCEVVLERYLMAEAYAKAVENLLRRFRDFDASGSSRLRRADAFSDAQTQREVQLADLIFCNNVVFPSELLAQLREFVLAEIKLGAVLISPQRLIRGSKAVREKMLTRSGVCESDQYWTEPNNVSWTDKPIEYWKYVKKRGGCY
jgi:hypothetical protein